MKSADRPVPRHSPIPFHVAVETEQFAIDIEGDVVGVALAGGEQFRVLPVEIHADDETAGRLFAGAEAVAILRARQHHIVGIILVRRSRQEISRHADEVAADHVKLLVRTEDNAVRAVLTIAPLPFAEQFDAVELVVAVGVPEAVEVVAFLAAAIHIQAAGGVEQSHGAAHGQIDGFHLCNLAAVIERDPQHRFAPLRGDDQAASRIDRHGNPRAFPGLGAAEQFNLEPFEGLNLLGGRGLASGRCGRLREGANGGRQQANGGQRMDACVVHNGHPTLNRDCVFTLLWPARTGQGVSEKRQDVDITLGLPAKGTGKGAAILLKAAVGWPARCLCSFVTKNNRFYII